MITAKQLKKGTVVEINGEPHTVSAVITQSPSARGGATLYKIRANGVLKGQKVDLSCKGDESFREVDCQKKPIQILYREPDKVCFMDLEDYSQFHLPETMLQEELQFLLENMEVTALVIDGVVRGIQLPDTVDLKITQCDPAIRGSSATARTKSATVETGYTLQVPEYLEEGEQIKVDTRNGKYVSRA